MPATEHLLAAKACRHAASDYRVLVAHRLRQADARQELRLLWGHEACEAAPGGGTSVEVVVEGELGGVLARPRLHAPMVLQAVRAPVESPHFDVSTAPQRGADRVARELVQRARS